MNKTLLACATILLLGCEKPATDSPALAIRQILGEPPAAGFLSAATPRDLEFPRDHGPHFGFRDEWWYVTGNVQGDDGRRFGFQFTLFRHQLRPGDEPGATGWTSAQTYMGHFALTDIEGNTYHHFERFGRPAAGVAGSQTEPFAVWLDDWRLTGNSASFAPLQLQAQADNVALQLQLTPTLPPVPQGERGLSRKSAQPGNASYYYSMPRLQAQGTVRDAKGATHPVQGLAWLDREWSTSALSAEQAGWDWFALHLSDGRSLMLYQMRRRDGKTDPFSYGALVDADGASHSLGATQFQLTPLDTWRSGAGQKYPIRWRVQIPQHRIDLQVRAAIPQQWFNASFQYWEGAAIVESAQGKADGGNGYLEMTGY